MISRRRFTSAGLCLVGLSACSPGATTGTPGNSASDSADVLILGGGISGLNAARILKQHGLKPIVLEAANRVGGRMQTVATRNGPLDLGASQIGRGYGRTISLCKDLGLSLVPEDRDLLPFGMHYKGEWIETESWASNPLNRTVGEERTVPPMMMGRWAANKYMAIKDLPDWLDPNYADYDISLRALMEQNGNSAQALDLAQYSVPGIGLDETSVLRMWQESLRGRIERDFTKAPSPENQGNPMGEVNDRNLINRLPAISNIEGGCQKLPEAIATELGDAVRLGKKVSGISMTASSATVTCEDGSTYSAKFVISALPFTLLRKVKIISETENAITRQAINTMPYANTARLYMTIKEPFWQRDGLPASFTTDGPLGMFWAIDNSLAGGDHRGMIVLVGQAGERITSNSNAIEFLLTEFERLRPASKGLIELIAYKDWAADPNQLGCGFSLAPGDVNAYARDMTRPWQVLHFAGEHTRKAEFGMEAALESSERVAFEILERV